MKRIEDIEKMSIAELQDEASRLDVAVPADLVDGIQSRIGHYRRQRAGRIRYAVAACLSTLFVCSVLLGITISGRMAAEPVDTFTDPEMAYAEVERALGLFSEALSAGATEATESEALFAKQRETIERLMK